MRRTQLSNWLKSTVAESVSSDSSETYPQRIFSLLTGLQIAEALKLVSIILFSHSHTHI